MLIAIFDVEQHPFHQYYGVTLNHINFNQLLTARFLLSFLYKVKLIWFGMYVGFMLFDNIDIFDCSFYHVCQI